MLRMALTQLRARFGRALALAGALLVAVTAFAVLTATATTQRLEVTGTVNANARGAYDLLVRPAGARSALEASSNLVSSTALTGLSGGITTEQWQAILHLPDIAVAAPVAVVGYALPTVWLPIDLSSALDSSAATQVLRIDATQVSERGLTHVATTAPGASAGSYAYVTDQPMDTTLQGGAELASTGTAICSIPTLDLSAATNSITPTVGLACGTTNPDDSFNSPGPVNTQATGNAIPAGQIMVPWSFPYLIEAIDPVQEAKLVGLSGAITQGGYFAANQDPTTKTGDVSALLGDDGPSGGTATVTEIPVLLADRTSIDEQLQISVGRLPAAAGVQITAGDNTEELAATLPHMSATKVSTVTVTSGQAYASLLTQLHTEGAASLDGYVTALPISYTAHGSGLAANALPAGSNKLLPSQPGDFLSGTGDLSTTGDLPDTAVRKLALHSAVGPAHPAPGQVYAPPQVNVVGEFDPAKLTASSSGLGAVPLETYFPAQASGGDAASKAALGGDDLLPNGNIAGLLSVPPSMITTLSALSVLDNPQDYDNQTAAAGSNPAAPISVIRVRLSGSLGTDAVSRERVRLAAQRIHDATGLDVDVTMGSSPAPVTVSDPAGTHGRPPLNLAEMWSRKGVAAVVLAAVDRKSVLLFVLVLVVCALFVAAATSAAVRGRRTELAILACLGWPPGRLRSLILSEVGIVGLTAGVCGAIVSIPVGRLAGVHVDVGRAALAVPAALLLSLLAALYPAMTAARAHPGEAVRPSVSAPRRAVHLTDIVRLGLANLRRVPGRSALGVVGLAIGVASLVALTGISAAFHGAVAGSLLGDAVTVQVRGSDYVAAGIAAALGTFTVADVLYMGIRERAGEYALLTAVGWTDAALRRLVLAEAVAMAITGAVLGVALGIGGVVALTGRFPTGLALVAAACAAGAVGVTVAAALIPAGALRRLSPAGLLAEE